MIHCLAFKVVLQLLLVPVLRQVRIMAVVTIVMRRHFRNYHLVGMTMGHILDIGSGRRRHNRRIVTPRTTMTITTKPLRMHVT